MFSQSKRLFAIGLLAILAACGSGDDDPPNTVVEIAQSDARFSILVEAIVAADLATTLSGPGPFTVFAPTDTAFADLLGELDITKAQLLADKTLLTQVLTYHVLPAQVPSGQVPVGASITTLQGGTFTVNSDLLITDQRSRTARITEVDLQAGNGVVHVIDRVILPPL